MSSRNNILAEIIAHKRSEVEAARARVPLPTLQQGIAGLQPPRGFTRAVMSAIAADRPAVIAELKRASPSRGVIRQAYDPAAIARSYAAGGATCLSVLTDEEYFGGTTAHLMAARDAAPIPVLRKDFMIDSYQVYEARHMGADCILLIAACLDDATMSQLCALAQSLGMDVLIEVHDREELERAHVLRTPLIGINNRDLHTFVTDIQTTLGLLRDVFPDRTVVTESGIHTADQIRLLRSQGVDAFLVGEALMNAEDPGAKLQELFFG